MASHGSEMEDSDDIKEGEWRVVVESVETKWVVKQVGGEEDWNRQEFLGATPPFFFLYFHVFLIFHNTSRDM